jgi:hypothetical protein
VAADLEFRIGAELTEIKGALASLVKQFGQVGQAAQNAGKGNPFSRIESDIGGLNKTVGGAVSLVKGLVAAFVGFQAISAFRSLIAQGIEFNAVLEQSKLGIASIIAAQANLVDAQGKTVTGQQALAVAIGLSEQQMRELRIAGLETAATTQQLVQAYQAAIGAGIQAGLSLGEVRTVTIQLVQAASALGVPMDQLNQEVRSILDGTIDINSRVATTLGITNAQVLAWKQSGTLVEELNKRLSSFADAGKLAADNFIVIKSNAVEALQAIAGEITGGLFDQLKGALKDATSGIFDIKTLGITDAFKDLIDLARELTTDIGEGVAGAIRGAVALARELSAWIKENRASINDIVGSLGLVLKAFGELVAAAFSLVGGVAEVGVKTSAIATVLQTVSVLIAGIQDGFRLIAGVVVGIGATILSALISPIEKFISALGEAVATINKEAGETLLNAASDLRQIGARGFEAAGDILKPIADGEGAVARAIKRLDDLSIAAKKSGDAQKTAAEPAALGAITGAKNKPPIKNAADASDLAKSQEKLLKDEATRALRDLQARYDDSLIATRAYYAKRGQIQTAAIEAEIAIEKKKLAASQPGTKDALEATTQITLLERQKGDIKKEAARDTNRALKQLRDQETQLLIQDLENQGKFVEAAALRAKLGFDEIRKRMIEDSNTAGVALIDKLINTEAAKARFDELNAEADRALRQFEAAQQRISDQRAVGALGGDEAAEQQRQARQVAIDQLGVLNAKMQELAAKTNDPAIQQGAADIAAAFRKLAVEGVEGVKLAIQNLRRSLDDMKKSFADSATKSAVDGITNLFTSVADGSKTAGEALKDFVHDFAVSMLQMAARALATYLVLTALEAVSGIPAPVLAGASSAGAKKNHSGGMAGTGTPVRVNPAVFFGAPRYHDGGMVGLKADERPAILQTGEEVLTRTDPRNAKNGGANGGGNGTRIVNVLDPNLIAGYLESASGEQAVLNVIGRNPSKVSQLIR